MQNTLGTCSMKLLKYASRLGGAWYNDFPNYFYTNANFFPGIARTTPRNSSASSSEATA